MKAVATTLDDRIDQLYQLPLDQFTAARNALAKEAGARAAEVKKLEKPTLPAWVVNQLYWQQPARFTAVLRAAEAMRTAYKQMLAGKNADVRAAEEAHAAALRDAKQAARALLDAAGHASPEAVMMAVGDTLDALPGEERPGRLTKPLRRMGFNVLEGVPISARVVPLEPKAAAKPAAPSTATARERRAQEAEAREEAMARERLRFAEAAEREAEAALDRARRTLERAARTRERVAQELDEAVGAEKAAQKEQAAAEKALSKATTERQRLEDRLQR